MPNLTLLTMEKQKKWYKNYLKNNLDEGFIIETIDELKNRDKRVSEKHSGEVD